jgi:hypothetical protein
LKKPHWRRTKIGRRKLYIDRARVLVQLSHVARS